MSIVRAACIQMCSRDDLDENLREAGRRIAEAVDQGAGIVALPENFGFLSADERAKLALAEVPGQGPQQAFLAEQAARHGLWLLGGTLPLRVDSDPRRVHASSQLYGPDGACVADYHKIHLFDVRVGDAAYRESAGIAAGRTPVVATGAGVRMGLSVCYDLRFPELYRQLVALGAQLLTVPSAFTLRTGEAHWHSLVRARAIENQSFILAPNQCGHHAEGRDSYGHSLICDPWGELLAEAGATPGVICADLDFAHQQELRETFPCLDHRVL